MEKTEKEIKKKLLFRSVPTQPVTKNYKKITKKLKKLKNTIMASFQAKIGWKWLRKRENKNYRSVTQVGKGRESEKIKIIVPFQPDRLENIPKKQQKN